MSLRKRSSAKSANTLHPFFMLSLLTLVPTCALSSATLCTDSIVDCNEFIIPESPSILSCEFSYEYSRLDATTTASISANYTLVSLIESGARDVMGQLNLLFVATAATTAITSNGNSTSLSSSAMADTWFESISACSHTDLLSNAFYNAQILLFTDSDSDRINS